MTKSMILPSEHKEILLGNIYPETAAVDDCSLNNNSYCLFCERDSEEPTMASVPQAAFAAKKIRQNEDRALSDAVPMNYSSKYMNSIWGEYNRYSVHNLKKIMEENSHSCFEMQNKIAQHTQTVGKPSFTESIRNSMSISFNKLYN